MEENEKVTFIIETFGLLKICSHSHRNSKNLNYIFIKRRCENYMFCKPRGLTLRSSYTLRVISDSGTIEVEVSKNTTFWEENNFFIVSLTSENLPDILKYFCQVDSLYFFMARVSNVISFILRQMDTIPEGEYVDLNENNGGFCSGAGSGSGSGSTKPSTATSSPMVACILFFSSTVPSPKNH